MLSIPLSWFHVSVGADVEIQIHKHFHLSKGTPKLTVKHFLGDFILCSLQSPRPHPNPCSRLGFSGLCYVITVDFICIWISLLHVISISNQESGHLYLVINPLLPLVELQRCSWSGRNMDFPSAHLTFTEHIHHEWTYEHSWKLGRFHF